MTNSNTIINVNNLYKYFVSGIPVLKNINLSIPKGSVTVIIGRSGCGKTTLLRCLNCLEIADSGSINIDGIEISIKNNANNSIFRKNRTKNKDTSLIKEIGNYFVSDEENLRKEQEIRDKVGFLFQGLNLFPHLNIFDNIAISPKVVKGFQKNQAEQITFDILKKFGLEKFKNYYPHQISGGQAQRVAIGRTLAMSPLILLFDEPTSALDPELIEDLANIILQLKSENMTQIIVTHSIRFAEKTADCVIYMENGEIIESSPPSEIFKNPKDLRTRSFLSIMD